MFYCGTIRQCPSGTFIGSTVEVKIGFLLGSTMKDKDAWLYTVGLVPKWLTELGSICTNMMFAPSSTLLLWLYRWGLSFQGSHKYGECSYHVVIHLSLSLLAPTSIAFVLIMHFSQDVEKVYMRCIWIKSQ